MRNWKVGQEIVVEAQSFNHSDNRKIVLKYIGDGILEDISNGNQVEFNIDIFPHVYEEMNLPLGLIHNPLVRESYKVVHLIS